jgi:hypothetical protein
MPKTVSFEDLDAADLSVDALYQCALGKGVEGEPVSKLLKVANLGGFRTAGQGNAKKLVVLYTTGENKNWPDSLDAATGRFIYYGDNQKPGSDLHDTPLRGNKLLKNAFEAIHASPARRQEVPPFFVFQREPDGNGVYTVKFKGLAVPGERSLPATEDLVAVWKTTGGARFQNYRAIFTILDAAIIQREWINSLLSGQPDESCAPKAWTKWVQTGAYTPLISEPTQTIRSLEEQAPDTPLKKDILEEIYTHFKPAPHQFERFAARIYQLQGQRVFIDEITRASADGGRDAVGRYMLGLPEDPVHVEFALEAKCYAPGGDGRQQTTVGVKELARLISRLRNRQFGVLVTTSAVSRQAYQELREDGHPVIVLAGKDIADILIKNGYNTKEAVKRLLADEFLLA